MAVKDNLFALFSASAHMAEARDRVCGTYPHQRKVQPHTLFLYQGAYAFDSGTITAETPCILLTVIKGVQQ